MKSEKARLFLIQLCDSFWFAMEGIVQIRWWRGPSLQSINTLKCGQSWAIMTLPDDLAVYGVSQLSWQILITTSKWSRVIVPSHIARTEVLKRTDLRPNNERGAVTVFQCVQHETMSMDVNWTHSIPPMASECYAVVIVHCDTLGVSLAVSMLPNGQCAVFGPHRATFSQYYASD